MSAQQSKQLRDLADVLSQDVSFIAGEYDKGDPKGFWARSLIRTAVSLFEAEIYVMKQQLLDWAESSDFEDADTIQALRGSTIDVKSNGEVVSRNLRIPLKTDIKFTLKCMCELRGLTLDFDFNAPGWVCVLSTTIVRHRLTHPKNIDEQIVTAQEVENAMSATNWFYSNIIGFYKQMMEKSAERAAELESILKGNI